MNPMADQTYYTTYGPVRGTCGHRHRTPKTALSCARKDQAACHRLGGGSYSDRRVVRVPDGSAPGDLTRDRIVWDDRDDAPQYLAAYDIEGV